MIYIETNTMQPELNLAHEEYFLKKEGFSESVFMLWQNKPAIVVGKYQNTAEEIDSDYTKAKEIQVIRRITGGGAVYHDLGNLCYSFIFRDITPENVDFSIFAKPVVTALERLGVKAEISGRNDLTIDGMKFSGTAMTLHKNSLLFHGTLLYDSDLTVLSKALRVSSGKLESKGIKSVQSRVTNIKPHTREKGEIAIFKQALKQAVRERQAFTEYAVSPEEKAEIQRLAKDRYQTWDWIYGENPAAEMKNIRRYPGGQIEVSLSLRQGKISLCQIRGDFLGLREIEEVEDKLVGIAYERQAIETALEGIDVTAHFGKMDRNQIADCILGI